MSDDHNHIPASRARRLKPPTVGEALLCIAVAAFLAFLLLPPLCLVLKVRSLGFLDELRDPHAQQALLLSLKTSLAVAGVCAVIGTPVAFVLARYSFRGKGIIESLVQLPLLLPPVVAGMLLLMAFGKRGMLGGVLEFAGIELPYSTAAVVVVQTYLAAPFFIQAARGGLEAVPRELEEASRTLGASKLPTFFRVTLPLSWPAFTSGLILCWGRAMGEFGGTIMFAGNMEGATQTMPLRIFKTWWQDLDSALVLTFILMAFSIVVFAIGRTLVSRRGF
jgi:molybdate transport system permease protein